jgi:hypothetical protein
VKITYDYYTAGGEEQKTATVQASDFGSNNYASFLIDATGLTKNRWVKMEVASDLPPDPVDPDPVDDLAVTGTGVHTVDLSWTATGDDGNTGRATNYDVRYSTSTITAANWSSATQAGGEPSPGNPGATENFTVTGLQSGTTYYFAVKVLDETGNESTISNVVSASTGTSVTDTIKTGWDTSIRGNETGINHGTCTIADIKPVDDIDENYYLLKFDLSSIPVASNIVRADVSIYCYSPEGGADTDVFKMLVDWDEGGQCGTAGFANYQYRKSGQAWGGSHGPEAGTDYNAVSAGTRTLSTMGYHTWEITSLVQDWVNSSSTNYGMIFSGKEGLTWKNPQVFTLENGNNKPYLTVEYGGGSTTLETGPENSVSKSGFISPNPFRSNTSIFFRFTRAAGPSQITYITIYDLLGRKIAGFIENKQAPRFVWDGRDQRGNPVSSGIYFVSIRRGGQVIRLKMVMM